MNNEYKLFGTDGIRGKANTGVLTADNLVLFGKAIAKYFLSESERKHTILIGKDTRLSGYMIESAIASGITSMGVNVLYSGPIPTSGVSYLTRSMRVDAGVMISASHNPYEDNGIKIFSPTGFKLDDNIENEIEKLFNQPELLINETENLGKASRIDDAIGRYVVYLKETIPMDLSLEGLKIGVDCANGAAYQVAKKTFTELGIEIMAIGDKPNGKNINNGFGSLYPEVVANLVKENNLDLGVAFDGDADRVIFVDEEGTIIDGDNIIAIAAKYYSENKILKKENVVTTVMSNLGFENFLNSININLIRANVGDRYVLEKMIELDSNLGGEQSGHIIFRDLSTTGDGILSALQIIKILKKSGSSFSKLAKLYTPYPQITNNISVKSKPELTNIPNLSDMILKSEKALGAKGRVLVRYSGTENKARVMVECEELADCKKYVKLISDIISIEIGNG